MEEEKVTEQDVVSATEQQKEVKEVDTKVSPEQKSKTGVQEVDAPEQPIGFAYKEDDKITITGKQYSTLYTFLKAFEMYSAVVDIIGKDMLDKGISKPFYSKDIDEKGQLKPEFWGNEQKSKIIV